MAAELFSNYAAFKSFIGGRLNQSVKLESLEPTIYEAARRHITPWLGDTLYDLLVANTGLTAKQIVLREKVQRSLALLTVYEYSKIGGVEFGESGIHRIESDSRKTAYRYQERELREDSLTKGYNALEEMLRYLDANKADASFTAWAVTDEGKAHLSPLLNYATTFRLLTLPECDRYTYECIRPIINEVELYGVAQSLPLAYWEGLKARHIASTLTTPEKTLVSYIRSAIAHRAIEEAVKQRWIRIDGGRVSIMEDFGDQRNTNQTMPSTVGSGLYLTHSAWSDRYTAKWKDYISNNTDDFLGVFDEDSGGTNTDDDAWHINTEDESTEADDAVVVEKKRAIYRF